MEFSKLGCLSGLFLFGIQIGPEFRELPIGLIFSHVAVGKTYHTSPDEARHPKGRNINHNRYMVLYGMLFEENPQARITKIPQP